MEINKPKPKPTSIRLNADIYEKVKEEAEKEKRSISKQIELIIERYYDIRNQIK